jgi:hypothetical protein
MCSRDIQKYLPNDAYGGVRTRDIIAEAALDLKIIS